MSKKNPRSAPALPLWARFDRAAALRRMTREMGPLHGLLRDHVDYGLRLLNDSLLRAEQRQTHFVALMLFHQSLGQLDAVDELLRAGCLGPAQALMRSYLETGLQLLYVLHRDDDQVSTVFVVTQIKEQIRQIDIRLAQSPDQDVKAELLNMRAIFESQLGSDYLMRTAVKELDQFKGKPIPWYRAFKGAKSLREVARALDLEQIYDLLYTRMSSNVHGGTALMAMGGEPNAFRPLRDLAATYLPGLVQLNHDISLLLSTKLLGYFRPEDGLDVMRAHFENVGEKRLRNSPLSHLIEQFIWRHPRFKEAMEGARGPQEEPFPP